MFPLKAVIVRDSLYLARSCSRLCGNRKNLVSSKAEPAYRLVPPQRFTEALDAIMTDLIPVQDLRSLRDTELAIKRAKSRIPLGGGRFSDRGCRLKDSRQNTRGSSSGDRVSSDADDKQEKHA